jgi:hypothetical protein
MKDFILLQVALLLQELILQWQKTMLVTRGILLLDNMITP